MSTFANAPLLVTGASGQFGRAAVEALLARGATQIIAGTRNPAKLADLAAKGLDVRQVDFDDPASLPAAFAGVERLLLVSTDGIGKRIAQQTAAVEAAKTAGVKHIVYTSAPAARPNPDAGLNPEHFWTEAAIFASGLGFTILRNHMYAENTLMDGPQAIASGQLFGLIGDRGTSYVARTDAARAAAGALLSAETSTVEDVTGPAPVTNAERAKVLSALSGRPVSVIAVEPSALKAGMVAGGVPEGMAAALLAFQRDAVAGHHGVVTDVVEHYSGQKPKAFADVLADHRAAFAAR